MVFGVSMMSASSHNTHETWGANVVNTSEFRATDNVDRLTF